MERMELMKICVGILHGLHELHVFSLVPSPTWPTSPSIHHGFQESRTPVRYRCRRRLDRMTAAAQIRPPHNPSVTATAVS